ncbi:MAG: hypothetical protein ACR2RF_23780 [Geminicoccaceae bacterium]
MFETSKKNLVIGPIEVESTVAYAQLIREGTIDWTSGKEWRKKFFSSTRAKQRLDLWQQKFANGRRITSIIEHNGSMSSGRASLDGFVYMFNSVPIGIMTIKAYAGTGLE